MSHLIYLDVAFYMHLTWQFDSAHVTRPECLQSEPRYPQDINYLVDNVIHLSNNPGLYCRAAKQLSLDVEFCISFILSYAEEP